MQLPEYVKKTLDRLNGAGCEAYIVGGCVRDCLLGKEPTDYDVTTSALPEEIKSVFADCKTLETGIAFGTVRVIIDGETVEVTTFRTDGSYSDNRRPDSVEFTPSLSEDLARRDFTINAMAYSPESGLIDLHGGREDLNKRLIRAVGDPEKRFREDALRILRAMRFASCLEFSIEEETADAVHRCAGLLENISAERVFIELKKLLCGNGCEAVLRDYHDVFAVFLPEIEKCRGFDQRTKYHDRDVYEHIIGTVTAIEPQPHLRLAMLLHDIAKPDYCVIAPDGTGHFKGHPAGSAATAERFLGQMKADSRTKERVIKLVKYHDIVIEDRVPLLKRYLNRFGEELFEDIIKVHIADDSAKAPEYRNRIPTYERVRETVAEIIASEQCFKLRDLKVKGSDMTAIGLSGKEVGDMLQFLLERVIDGELENEKSALISAAKKEKNK